MKSRIQDGMVQLKGPGWAGALSCGSGGRSFLRRLRVAIWECPNTTQPHKRVSKLCPHTHVIELPAGPLAPLQIYTAQACLRPTLPKLLKHSRDREMGKGEAEGTGSEKGRAHACRQLHEARTEPLTSWARVRLSKTTTKLIPLPLPPLLYLIL